jgi:polysaccharide pyruvyl transferase WcaK-like protein
MAIVIVLEIDATGTGLMKGNRMKQHIKNHEKITLFGHFDSTNFGNESTLLTILYHLRRFQPNAEFTCISTGPKATAAVHHINSIPIETRYIKYRRSLNSISRIARWIFIYAPCEIYQWTKCFIRLGGIDVLIIPGTGLLTDACGLVGWGPYNLFKWSLIAKVRHCKLLFVSVGAGPIYSTMGKFLIKSALSCADFRSYRDAESKKYIHGIGFRVENDPIYPDLVFGIPETLLPHRSVKTSRCVVGLGIMESSGRYGTAGPSPEIQQAYLHNLAAFATWLLAHDYDIRLLIGDLGDIDTVYEFLHLLRDQLPTYEGSRIINEPVSSAEDLLSQIAETDIVIATRFHNVLLSLLCNKPTVSISFHHKCKSLMRIMGLSEYCLDINKLDVNHLIEAFCDIKINSDKINLLVRDKIRESRAALDEQYKIIAKLISDGMKYDYTNMVDSNNKNKKCRINADVIQDDI